MEKRMITLGDKRIEITHFGEPMNIEFSNLGGMESLIILGYFAIIFKNHFG